MNSVTPDVAVVLAIGQVTGYGEINGPVPSVAHAPSLLVKITNAVAGLPNIDARQVVPLFFGSDCSSTARDLTNLKESYPIGADVVILASQPLSRNADGVIVAESNRGGFVVVAPSAIARTPWGDLDFSRLDPHNFSDFSWFEYHRSVLGLRRDGIQSRLPRLLNIAHFGGLQYSNNGRSFLERLMRESRLSPAERRQVLRVFDDREAR